MARAVSTPMVTTLHTPPTPWLESAIQLAPSPVTFVAVSHHTARAWSHAVPDISVVNNGVDLERWPVGPGGGGLVWFGRLVAEKGPHLAIEAARRAQLPLDVIGPRFDEDYFHRMVEPRLGHGVRYLGHLDQATVAAKVGRASATLVTPCWDEPYGLVVAESLACGTPVAAFDRGGVGEIIDAESGLLVKAGDVTQLATSALAAGAMSRAAARSPCAPNRSRTASTMSVIAGSTVVSSIPALCRSVSEPCPPDYDDLVTTARDSCRRRAPSPN
jgi:glycosyltransferase involved in cell wall biosynthesis